jgi:hypothetical protein
MFMIVVDFCWLAAPVSYIIMHVSNAQTFLSFWESIGLCQSDRLNLQGGHFLQLAAEPGLQPSPALQRGHVVESNLQLLVPAPS